VSRSASGSITSEGDVERRLCLRVSFHTGSAMRWVVPQFGVCRLIAGARIVGVNCPENCGTAVHGRQFRHDEATGVASFQLSPRQLRHNLPDRPGLRPSADRNGIT
jgi:hypothetical protein